MLTVSAIGSRDDELLADLRERSLRVTPIDADRLDEAHPAGSKGPDAFVVDIRGLAHLPTYVTQLRRRFPTSGLVIVSRTVDPTVLLEAMRIGVNEWIPEPVDVDQLVAAIHRVARPAAKPQIGRTIAVVGAKGGIGTTTVAVNLATALHKTAKEPTIFIDLHVAHGDSAVFLGVEPRFSVADALENIHRLDEAYLKALVTSTKAGIDLLASSTTLTHNSFDSAKVRSLLDFAATTYRYVVLDCPRSDARVLEAMDAASTILVLANQELTTLRTASRIVHSLRQRCGSERVKVALSRLDPKAEIGQPDVERVLGGPVKYVIPNDYRSSINALTRGEPLILQNHSRLASSLQEVARDVAGAHRKEKDKDAGKSGLFGRWR